MDNDRRDFLAALMDARNGKPRRDYLTALLQLREGRPSYLDLDALHRDAVHASQLLSLALEAIGEKTPGIPDGMRVISDAEYETILYAFNCLEEAVELAAHGWQLAQEAEQKKAA